MNILHFHSPILQQEILPPAEVCPVPHASLYGAFPNYAGIGANAAGSWPISWMQLSKPTGHYVSRLGMTILNFLLKKHAVVLVGNSCAPGLFFPDIDLEKGWEQFQFIPKQDCGTVVMNVLGLNDAKKEEIIFSAEPFMVLKLNGNWQNFNDYLKAMHSKYRVRAKKAISLSGDIFSEQILGAEITDDILEICKDLLKETLKNKTIALSQNLKGILQNYRDYCGNNFHLIIYRLHGKIIGFITWIKLGNTMHAMHVGYEGKIVKDMHIYQRMLYDLVDLGIKEKLNAINFGRTATEIKSTLGAEPVNNSYVIYIQNGILKAIVRIYKKYFFKPEIYIIRKPFKDL